MTQPRKRSTVTAPAKVNLGLAITGRRPDGYHELRSIVLRVGLSDTLAGAVAPDADGDRLSIAGEEGVPIRDNTVLRALALLRAARPATAPALDLQLQKRVPMAAGFGGGSSDGAAAFRLATRLWRLDVPAEERQVMAVALGADVPFFIARHPAAYVTGIGERVERLPGVLGDPGLLLVCPARRLSTVAVFGAFDELRLKGRAAATVDALAVAFRGGIDSETLVGWAGDLRDANDLWRPAESAEPSLSRLRSELETALGRPFLLTGSGSALFALYPSLRSAKDGGQLLASSGVQNLEGASVFAAGLDIDQGAWRIQ